MNEPTKAIVNVSEMARMVGLSRQRFYQLQGTTFPEPKRDAETNRPFYDEELQRICLEVRRRNCGVDGRPVLFYARRHPIGVQSKAPRKPKPPTKPKRRHTDLLDGLQSLGLATVSDADVEAALAKLFPEGTEGVEFGEVVRAAFLFLKCRDSGENVGSK